MKTVLVTGGAGYIGSHTCKYLQDEGYEVVVIDNLEKGHAEALTEETKLYIGNLNDKDLLDTIFTENEIDSVIHFAGYIEAGESMKNPLKFFDNNVAKTLPLFKAMEKHKVKKIVFSSSAGVYGQPKQMPIKEESETKPTNNYGLTKLMIEQILDSLQFKSICLRYFNAAGAGYKIGEDHDPETHLIPLILKVALGQIENIKIFGTDYKTPDGTGIRDYVHVLDLASAHHKALEALDKGITGKYNVGTGKGASVKEILEHCRAITARQILDMELPRRKGDPAELVACCDKIKQDLGWEAKYTIKDTIESAWHWHSSHPSGFKS